MTTRPSAAMRRQVFERAQGCCEYCLLPEQFCATSHQVDHIIAEKHGGKTTPENLAISCVTCNLRKASDIASIDPETGKLVAIFHPRQQLWDDEFSLENASIVGITLVGRVTVGFMQLNSRPRLIERAAFIHAGVYPPRAGNRKPK